MARHVDGDAAAVGTHQLAVVQQGRHVGNQLLAARCPRGYNYRDAGHGCQDTHCSRCGRGHHGVAQRLAHAEGQDVDHRGEIHNGGFRLVLNHWPQGDRYH